MAPPFWPLSRQNRAGTLGCHLSSLSTIGIWRDGVLEHPYVLNAYKLVEEANKLTAPSELLGIYRKFGDYPVSRHGAQALWGRETMAGMADGGLAAYGMPVGGRLVGMPSFGIGGLRARARLPAGLRPDGGAGRRHALRAGCLRQSPGEFGPGGRGAQRWRPAHSALVEVAPGSRRPRLSRATRT